jgi:hypothetical protein
MIFSKYGKSYDTADGSEQCARSQPSCAGNFPPPEPKRTETVSPNEAPPALEATVRSEVTQRWEDDGGSSVGGPLHQPPPSLMELSAKPGWSVQSLRELNKAIRLQDWPDNPAHLRRRAVKTERARIAAVQDEAARAAARADAERNRDRNPWEHT